MKKLLILTSATGAGHDTHAYATKQWCQNIYGDAVEVRIEHVLEDSHIVNRAGVLFYNWIQRQAPWFHHGYYHVLELLDYFHSGDVGFGKTHYTTLLDSYRPDAILSVHDCLNRGYFELARKQLGPGLRCGTYCVEFGGGYGFSKNWVNKKADYFFGRTDDTVSQTQARKLAPERTLVVGHWSPPSFYGNLLNVEQKKLFLCKTMNLSTEKFTLLLSTGGAGAQNHQKILTALNALALPIQVIALCGREEKIRLSLEQWAQRELSFPVRALGFRSDMTVLYQVSSAVLARAGATTAGEALLMGCPVIFNAMGGIMPQEIPTWRYFKKHGMGTLAYSAVALAQAVQLWLKRPERYQRIRQKMQILHDATTPEKSLRLLLNTGRGLVSG
jgi:processive 1,2-diacylglycerol beta-glucosyltransferase